MRIIINLKIQWSESDVIVTPIEPPSTVIKNITKEWYDQLNNDTISFIKIDGLCRVDDIFSKTINRTLIIEGTNNATILFGVENYNQFVRSDQGNCLFVLDNGAKVIIRNVNFCLAKQLKSVNSYLPTIFRSIPNHSNEWVALVQNCDTTILGNNGGMGLGTLYGSSKGNYIGAINFKHFGTGFTQAKANIGGESDGILYLVLQDVITDGSDEQALASHKTKVDGIFEDGLFTITSEHEVSSIYNHFYNSDISDNYAHILHVGRFTFMLDDNCDINNKQFKLRPNASGKIKIKVIDGKVYTPTFESHAGDYFVLDNITYNTIEKGRDEHPFWSNNHKPTQSDTAYHPYLKVNKIIPDGEYVVEWKSSFNLFGTEPTWILYKDSRFSFRSYIDTNFENWEIMDGDTVGHNMYNHNQLSLWAENVIQKGYYRQSQQGGKSLGYNMVNCEGFKDEFNPPLPITTDQPMPEKIKALI